MAISTISVTANTSTISVDTTTNTVSVTSTPTTVTVGTATAVVESEIRSTLSNVSPILYNNSTGVFSFDGSSVFTGRTTDDLAEGSTNKYFTAARARSNISVTDAGGIGSLAYNNGTGVITYTGINNSDSLPEGSTNQYFTTARARASVSGGTGLTYNASTGVFIVTGGAYLAPGAGTYETPEASGFTWDFGGYINVDGPDTNGIGLRIAPTALMALEGEIISQHGLGADGKNRFSMDDSNDANVRLSSQRRIDNFINASGNVANTAAVYTIQSNGANLSNSPTERFSVRGDGRVRINNAYNLPTSDGAGNTILRTNGADELSFTSIVGGEYNNVVQNASNITVDWDHQAINVTNDPGEFEEMLVFSGPNVPRRLRRAFVGLSLFDNDSNFITQAQANTKTLAHIATTGLTVGGTLTVNGNINATGNINTENVVDLNVQDQQITLNANAASNANTSIISFRPTGTSVRLRWNEQVDKWQFTNDGSSFYNIPVTTDDLAQGATNLYFGNARVRSFIDDSITTANISEQTNLYYTTARANTAITDYDGVLTPSSLTATGNIQGAYVKGNGSELSGLTTSQVGEGTNLYYTTARANSAIADYEGIINTGNTITGTTVTGSTLVGTTELKTNQVKPNSSDTITFADTNDIKLGALKLSTSYITGNVIQSGSYTDKVMGISGTGISSEAVVSTSDLTTRIGSTNIGGASITKSGPFFGVTPPQGVRGIDGSATFTAGSNVVSLVGLQKLVTNANPYSYLGAYSLTPRTTVNLTDVFQANMVLRLGRTGSDMEGPFPKGTVINSVANSSVTGGIANVILKHLQLLAQQILLLLCTVCLIQ